MSNVGVVARCPREALRAVFPTLKQQFSDVAVRFLANHWSPVRVVDETHEAEPRIWLRALNMDVVWQNNRFVVRSHPKKYGGDTRHWPVADEHHLVKTLHDLIDPYRISLTMK